MVGFILDGEEVALAKEFLSAIVNKIVKRCQVFKSRKRPISPTVLSGCRISILDDQGLRLTAQLQL
jgi:hypothetical protein